MIVPAAGFVLVALHPATLGFDELPWPPERRPQAEVIGRFLDAVESNDTVAFARAIVSDARVTVGDGSERQIPDASTGIRLEPSGFARLLDGCDRVWDFGIPSEMTVLMVTWRCGDHQRNAMFTFAGTRIERVHFRTRYVVYAPPPPPPMTPAQIAEQRRQRETVGLVRNHYLVLARAGEEELAAFYERVESIPVADVSGPTNLRDYYARSRAEAGMALRGCRLRDVSPPDVVRCRLRIARTHGDGAIVETDYQLDYIFGNAGIERLAVTELSEP